MRDPSVLGIGEPPANPASAKGAALQMLLCLSDEEAAALNGVEDAELPPPSAIRCMNEKLGDSDALVAIFSGEQVDDDVAFSLFTSALACEVDFALRATGG